MPIRRITYSIVTIFFVLLGLLVVITPVKTLPNQNMAHMEVQSRTDLLNTLGTGFVLNNISGGNQPKGIFFDPYNNFLYAAAYSSKSVFVINITSNTVVTTIPTGANAWQLTYNPNKQYLYVSNDRANYVTVINTMSNTAITNISTGSYGYDVGVFYDIYNQLLYIETNQDNFMLVVNTTTNTVVSALPVGNSPGNSNVAIDKNNYLYVADHLSDTINIIDGNNNSVIKTVIIGKAPGATLYDPYNGYIYISLIGFATVPENTIVVYDPVNYKIVKCITVGEFPSMMYYDPLHHAIYELNIHSDSLGIINDTTNTFMGSIPVGSSPTGLTLTTNDTYVYITDTGDNLVGYMNLSLVLAWVNRPLLTSTTSSLSFSLLSIFLGMLSLVVLYRKTLQRTRRY